MVILKHCGEGQRPFSRFQGRLTVVHNLYLRYISRYNSGTSSNFLSVFSGFCIVTVISSSPLFPPKGFFLDLLPIIIEAAIKLQGFLFLYLSCILAYKYVGRGGENKALISFQPSTPLLTLWLSLFCFSFFRIYEESVRKYLAKKTS